MKFCPECGTCIEEDARFCHECGFSLDTVWQDPLACIDSENVARKLKANMAGYKNSRFSCFSGGDSMMTVDEVLSLLDPQSDILLQLCRSYPDIQLYSDIYKELKSVTDRLRYGDIKALSENDRGILGTLTEFWMIVTDTLLEKDPVGFRNEIELYRKYSSDLNYILSHRIAVSEQPVYPSNESRSGICKNDFDPSVMAEIESLSAELHEMKPSFKRISYNPYTDYREELYKLVGLEKLKSSIDDHILDIKVQMKRKERFPDLKINSSFNCIFKGKPGTGKTSVARLLSGLLKQEGLVSNGCCVEVDASSLVSGYVGFSAKVAKFAALQSFGGVLFIDEAYSLMNARGSKSDAGAEVIDTLTPLMENHRDKLIVILAGYDKEMDLFLQSANTGFPSRFKAVFQFEDYNEEELLDIFLKFAEAEHYSLTPEAEKRVKTILWFIVSQKDNMRQFANARTARNLYEYIRSKCTKRMNKEGLVDLCTVKLEDVNLDRSEIDMIINK